MEEEMRMALTVICVLGAVFLLVGAVVVYCCAVAAEKGDRLMEELWENKDTDGKDTDAEATDGK